jgi:hypothetical protein
MTFAIGLLAGLLAAATQALTYLLSRHFVLRTGQGPLRLLGLAHVWMGAAGLLLFLLCWPRGLVWDARLLLTGGHFLLSYLTAQYCFFWTMRHAPPSRVAPLMGLKIVILAGLVAAFGMETLGPWHWLAVALTLAATVLVERSGAAIGWRGWAGTVATITAFASSDLAIRNLLVHLREAQVAAVPLVAAGLTYAICLPVGVVIVWAGGRLVAAERRPALAYAATWFGSMLCLYAAIDLLGVVLAVMLQCLRGPLTVLAAAAWRTGGEREQRFTGASLLRQLGAALVMAGASALYAAAGWLGR